MKFCRAKSPLSVYIAYVLVVKINTEESEVDDVSRCCVWLCLRAAVSHQSAGMAAARLPSANLLGAGRQDWRKKSGNSFVD